MAPFVWAGWLAGMIFPLKQRPGAFMFFPSADIGGAPQVNIDITHCVADLRPLIIFSKRPRNNQFKTLFHETGVDCLDLSPFIDRKIAHFVNFFFRGVLASWISRAGNPVVFGGESLYFYKVIPHLPRRIRCIELCHLPTWLPYSIGFVERIDTRVFSTRHLQNLVMRQYEAAQILPELRQRLCFIENAIDLPEEEKSDHALLEVVFIGRGAPQKRVPLIGAIARQMHEAGDPVHFSFVGDVQNVLDPSSLPYCRFYGNVSDSTMMRTIYRGSDVLLLTSAYEGLPVVVMTMMAYGRTIVTTAVNALPDYIRHMDNGLLITETDDGRIVEQGIAWLRLLIRQPELLKQFGEKNRELAIQKFNRRVFCKEYRQLFIPKA
jgi:glycosyltransferase involved in cell wall biosynthesis